MKIQEIIQKIRHNSASLLLKSRNAKYLSICLDIYNEIKDLSPEEFESLLEAIKDKKIVSRTVTSTTVEGEIEEEIINNEILLKQFLIQACLFFDPELNQDEKDIDKRVSYLNRLMNKGINVNKTLHLYTQAPLALAIMSNSVKIVEFLIKEKNAHLQGEKIKYVIGLLDYNLEMIKDKDRRADIIKILRNIAKFAINDRNSEGCESILDFISAKEIALELGTDIIEELKSFSEVKVRILAKNLDKLPEDQAYILLALAIENGSVELAKKLINLVQDVNIELEFLKLEDRLPILLGAIRCNQLEIIKLLIAKGADINIDADNGGVLDHVTHFNYHERDYDTNINIELLKYILVKSIDRGDIEDNANRKSLHYAARYGLINELKMIIASGVDVEIYAGGDLGETPLHSAAVGDHKEIVQELLSRDANINTPDNYNETPLHYAAKYGSLEAVEALLANGANPNIQNRKGMTPLHMAIEYDKIEVVKLLIEKGADVSLCGANGRRVLDYVPHLWSDNRDYDSKINIELLKYVLVSSLGRCGIGYDRNSHLHYATRYGLIDELKLIIAHDASVNIQNYRGHTPLHSAAFGNHVEVTKELLARGADPNIQDNNGKTPLNLATNTEIIQLLEEKAQLESQIPTKPDIPNRFVANDDKRRKL